MATCVGPPDTIAAGCPTVLIGDGGAGGGGGGGGGAGGAAGSATMGHTGGRESIEQMETMIAEVGESATAGWGEVFNGILIDALGEQAGDKESTTRAEHWIEFVFVDTAGLPVSGVPYQFTDTEAKVSDGKLPGNGTIARDGIPAGQGKVELRTLYNARWSKTMAKVDEVVQMTADVDGIAPGTKAVFQVYKRDVKGPPELVDTVLAETQATTVEADWVLTLPEGSLSIEVPEEDAEDADVEKLGYSAPDYYFEVVAAMCLARSNLLNVEDYIEVEASDEDANPLKEEPYVLFACTGEVREGALNGSGFMREDRIPAGMCNLRLPKIPDVAFEGPATDGGGAGSGGSAGGTPPSGSSNGGTKGGFDDPSGGTKGGFGDPNGGTKGGFDDPAGGTKGGFGDPGGGTKGGFGDPGGGTKGGFDDPNGGTKGGFGDPGGGTKGGFDDPNGGTKGGF
jgi:hypothetical protein